MAVESEPEAGRSGLVAVDRTGPYFLWIGGFVAAALVVATFAMVVSSMHALLPSSSQPVLAAVDPTLRAGDSASTMPVEENRTSCQEIGRTDLRSPGEGVWFQSNCIDASGRNLLTPALICNRKALDPAEFREVAPGLHVFRQSWASAGYLWYATSEGCSDLVSARIVTAVCIDLTVSFSWDTMPCTDHGGVLTWVNGP